jgi:hypothetical protein
LSFLGAFIALYQKLYKFSQTSMTCDGYMILDKYYISGVGVKSNSLEVPIVIKIPCFRASVVIWPSCSLRTVCCHELYDQAWNSLLERTLVVDIDINFMANL